jgi:hypothetical protein
MEFKKQTRLEASGGKKDVRPCICFYIDSIFTWIVTSPCALTLHFIGKENTVKIQTSLNERDDLK